jgi:hypothetical protein
VEGKGLSLVNVITMDGMGGERTGPDGRGLERKGLPFIDVIIRDGSGSDRKGLKRIGGEGKGRAFRAEDSRI